MISEGVFCIRFNCVFITFFNLKIQDFLGMNVSQLSCENAVQISGIFLKGFGPIVQTALELGLRTFRSGPCHDRILKATDFYETASQ